MHPDMAITDREALVTPSGALDISSAELLEAEVHALRRAGCSGVVVDLRRVEFLDSYGLRILLALRNAAARDGFRLVLSPGPAPVQRVFDLTATRSLFSWVS